MDPFHIDGPALVSFSGGRTSAYMLRRILDAHGGRLPVGVHAVFANTGREREETLRFVADCAERWGVEIVWLERDAAEGYRETTNEHARRDGAGLRADDRGDAELAAIAADLDALLARAQRYLDGSSEPRADRVR